METYHNAIAIVGDVKVHMRETHSASAWTPPPAEFTSFSSFPATCMPRQRIPHAALALWMWTCACIFPTRTVHPIQPQVQEPHHSR